MPAHSKSAALILGLVAVFAGFSLGGATPPKATPKTAKKKTPKKKSVARRSVPAISPAVRLAAHEFVESKMAAAPDHILNLEALIPFFVGLARAQATNVPVHILQYGDSHTASDDWPDAMRKPFQEVFGNGGPGFTTAGYPFRGYRRYDIRGYASPGWVTSGTVAHQGDGRNGLSGLSVTASRPGEYVSVTASGEQLELFYLNQPGGGAFTISDNGDVIATVSTDEAFGTGTFRMATPPGEHLYRLQTTDRAPVRLYGWVSEQTRGLTWETLGINGAQSSMLLDWDQALWTEQLQRRKPSLILLAYGTNEALYPRWTREAYRAKLLALIATLKQTVPNASLLLIGPPECGRLRPFPYLKQVVEVQIEVAKETGVAFWDWALHMEDSGGRRKWVQAGYSQADYTHLTGEGYRLLGRTLASELLLEYRRATQTQSNQAGH